MQKQCPPCPVDCKVLNWIQGSCNCLLFLTRDPKLQLRTQSENEHNKNTDPSFPVPAPVPAPAARKFFFLTWPRKAESTVFLSAQMFTAICKDEQFQNICTVLAKDGQSAHITNISVVSERFFSKASRIASAKRASLAWQMAGKLHFFSECWNQHENKMHADKIVDGADSWGAIDEWSNWRCDVWCGKSGWWQDAGRMIELADVKCEFNDIRELWETQKPIANTMQSCERHKKMLWHHLTN